MGAFATRVGTATRRFVDHTITPRVSDRGWREQAWFVLATLALLLFMVRVLAASWPGQFKIFFPDSFSFLNVARHTPFSFQFWADERPVAYPALLFLAGRSTVVAVVVQTFLYGFAYLFVAVTACRVLRHIEARIVVVFFVIALAIEPRFALWNTHILSESFGMTLAAFSIAAWWRFAAEPSTRRLNWAGVASVGWILVRDSNVPPWLAVGFPALLVASFWWRSAGPQLRKAMRVWALATLVVCIGVTLGQASNGRNRYPTMNNIGLRVLPLPATTNPKPSDQAEREEMTQWFEDQGMPVDAALLQRAGTSSFDNNWDMLTSPDLQRFRDWADSEGQTAMLLSYVRFAPHWISSLHHDLPVLLRSDQSAYDAFGVAKRLPSALPAQLAGPSTVDGLVVWTLLAAASLALAAFRRRGVQSVVLGLLLVSCFVDLYMSYVGDSVEVQRHMVGPLSRMTLVMLVCVGVGLDAVVGILRGEPGDDVDPTEIEGDDESDDDAGMPELAGASQ